MPRRKKDPAETPQTLAPEIVDQAPSSGDLQLRVESEASESSKKKRTRSRKSVAVHENAPAEVVTPETAHGTGKRTAQAKASRRARKPAAKTPAKATGAEEPEVKVPPVTPVESSSDFVPEVTQLALPQEGTTPSPPTAKEAEFQSEPLPAGGFPGVAQEQAESLPERSVEEGVFQPSLFPELGTEPERSEETDLRRSLKNETTESSVAAESESSVQEVLLPLEETSGPRGEEARQVIEAERQEIEAAPPVDETLASPPASEGEVQGEEEETELVSELEASVGEEAAEEEEQEAEEEEAVDEPEEEPEVATIPMLVEAGADERSPEERERWRKICEAAHRLGIQRLYPEQERAILAAMEGRDVLVVLPTGFGKSACYQIPSMVLPQPVVLVSPLLALLKDQQEKLLARGIPVERIDGTIRGKARQEALERIARGGSLLVMTTPETLGAEELGAALRRSGISLAAVDEAHCISEWGHDFRPAYMRLGERLRQLGSPPVLALTATATQAVRDDIIRYLGMRDPAIVASSPHRANLAFEVVHATGNERLRALTRFIKRLRRPGIVYCSTTKAVDELYGALRLLRLPVHRYHGKMAAKDRNREQELFMKRGRRTIMVATSAFGLGIDKPDIRYIIHYQAPASLEQYVQEAGRAGRDGRRAHCILLFDPKDRETHEVLQQGSRIRPDQLYRISTVLAAYAAEGREPDMEALTLAAQLNERQAKALLVVLEEAELVKLHEDRISIVVPAEDFEEQARALATRFVTLRTQDARRLDRIAEYAFCRECRAVFLRRYFGEEDGTPCGLCDNCRGAGERPATFYQPIARPQPQRKKRRKRKKRKSGAGRAQVIVVRQSAQPQAPLAQENGEALPDAPLSDLGGELEPLPVPSEEN